MNALLRLHLLVVTVTVLSIFSGPALASILAIQEFSVTGSAVNRGDNRTWGWQFTPDRNIQVISLGFWDQSADGFVESHRVGIWDSGGALLTDVVLAAGTTSPLAGPEMNGGQGRFRFESIAPLNLNANTQYVIGGNLSNEFFYHSGGSVTTSADLLPFPISGLQRNTSDANAGFAFPHAVFVSKAGYYGPNFTYVPEPGTLALLGLGLAGLGFRRAR